MIFQLFPTRPSPIDPEGKSWTRGLVGSDLRLREHDPEVVADELVDLDTFIPEGDAAIRPPERVAAGVHDAADIVARLVRGVEATVLHSGNPGGRLHVPLLVEDLDVDRIQDPPEARLNLSCELCVQVRAVDHGGEAGTRLHHRTQTLGEGDLLAVARLDTGAVRGEDDPCRLEPLIHRPGCDGLAGEHFGVETRLALQEGARADLVGQLHRTADPPRLEVEEHRQLFRDAGHHRDDAQRVRAAADESVQDHGVIRGRRGQSLDDTEVDGDSHLIVGHLLVAHVSPPGEKVHQADQG